jgi:hypothetical protein
MKYPWVAISLGIIWISTTFIILKKDSIDATYILMIAFVGTIIISLIGLRAPKIKK